MLKEPVKEIYDNGYTKQGHQSYIYIFKAGKVIGLKGETHLRVVLSDDGAMLTTYPQK